MYTKNKYIHNDCTLVDCHYRFKLYRCSMYTRLISPVITKYLIWVRLMKTTKHLIFFHKMTNRFPFYLFMLFITSVLSANNECKVWECPLPDSYKNVKKKFTLVIDAGHGGKDGGTVGKYSKEKDIALSIAMGLGEKIEKNLPDVTVIYTRKDDTFIPLFERVILANEVQADLFISIHCNASRNKNARGTETYVMGLHTADENLETAKRENASILLEADFEENYDGFDPNSDAGHIILSMYQNLYLDKSIELATLVEKSFGLKTSRGVKQAGFVVLKRATMPSVLVETGFLSNPDEEIILNSIEGQRKIIFGLYDAFVKYKIIHYQQKKDQIQTPDPGLIVNKDTESVSSNDNNIWYTVQLAATSFLNKDAFKDVPDLEVIKVDALYKYFSGKYPSKDQANHAREALSRKGYKGAFIVPSPANVHSLVQKD